MQKNVLDISWGAILKVFLALVVVYFLYQITDILVLFLFALVISMLFNPSVEFLRKVRIPRPVAVLFIYLSFFGILSLLVYLGVPGFAREIREFSTLVPEYLEKMSPLMQSIGMQAFESVDSIMELLKESSDKIAASMINALVAIFGGAFTTMFVITMAIFLSLEGNPVEKAIGVFASSDRRERALSIWRRCRVQVSSWFLVRILACLFVGISSYLVFYLFGVNYALLFSVIAGFFNLIPFIGPLVSGILFFIIISLDSVTKAAFVVLAFMIIQTIESSVLSPVLSRRFMGVSPVLVLIAIVIGGSLWGILGAFLAIPLLGILFEFFKEYMQKKN